VPMAEAWSSWAWGLVDVAPPDLRQRNGWTRRCGRPQTTSTSPRATRDPAEWQQPRSAPRCTDARAWTQVKWYYCLTVDPAEKSALTGML
jgi:hypothetical protein